MDIKAQYSENKIGLYKNHICKDKDMVNEDLRIVSNFSGIKPKYFPPIKNNEDKKINNINIKRELSPININTNLDNYSFEHLKNQLTFNIFKNRFKRRNKFGIIDFPVLNNYFNS